MQLLNRLAKLTLLLCLVLLALLQPGIAREAADRAEYDNSGLILWREPLTNQEFVWLQGGCFQMGQSPTEKNTLKAEANELGYLEFYADELPRHEVCLEGFWLERHEVTQLQWTRLMATRPFILNVADENPATNISWLMSINFINVLNGVSNESFRLPTEAELEYAIRAGTTTPFHTGKTISTSQANYNGTHTYGTGKTGTYLAGTTPVKSFPPNQFGLFDMHGNVWEWCSDWYDKDYYQHSPADNPKGPVTGKSKVMRGGSWFTAPRSVRSANRRGLEPDVALDDSGFRLVANRPPPTMTETGYNPNF